MKGTTNLGLKDMQTTAKVNKEERIDDGQGRDAGGGKRNVQPDVAAL